MCTEPVLGQVIVETTKKIFFRKLMRNVYFANEFPSNFTPLFACILYCHKQRMVLFFFALFFSFTPHAAHCASIYKLSGFYTGPVTRSV